MKAIGQDVVRDLLFLSLTAGSADAAGYMGLGRVFTSNMTGNVVLLGIDLGQGHLASAGRTLSVLAIFILGLAMGVWLGRSVRERDWPNLAKRLISLEKVLLILFAFGWVMSAGAPDPLVGGALLLLLTLAMGLQSAAMNRLSAPGARTTAITGTLTELVTGLVLLMTTRLATTDNDSNRIKFQSAMIALYCCGAAVCGFLILHYPPLAGCVPALAVMLVWPRSSK